MLSRCYRFLGKCLLLFWCLHWIWKGAEHIAFADRFFTEWRFFEWSVCLRPLLFAGLIGIFIWAWEKLQPEGLLYRSEAGLVRAVNRLEKRFWPIRLLRSCYLLFGIGVLAVFGASFGFFVFDNGTKVFATISDHFGRYELAEKSYKLAWDKGDYSSSAGWHTCSTVEDDLTTSKRNAAVAAVYGESSLQMAARYYRLGFMHGQPSTFVEDDIACDWFENALQIYEKQPSAGERIDCLAQLAATRWGDGKRAEAREFADRAAQIISENDGQIPHTYKSGLSRELLRFTADELGKKEQAALFQNTKFVKEIEAGASHRGALTLILLGALFGSGLGQTLSKECWLIWLSRRSSRGASRLPNDSAFFSYLSDLVSLDLYRRDLPAALGHSEYLLGMAQQCQPNKELMRCNSADRRRLLLVTGSELFSAGLAIVLAWSFFV